MNKEILNPLKIQKYWKDQKPPNLNELKEGNKKFLDRYFPPNENSLVSKDENNNYIDSIEGPNLENNLINSMIEDLNNIIWKRPKEVKPDGNWQLFEGKIEFDDVKQGSISDCYFLSSITCLTAYPYLVVEKFRTSSYNEEGYYEMIFFIDGEWQIVFVDDYFPYDIQENNWVFAKPNKTELWALLLEKAWAKLNGGYSNIIKGKMSEAICSLTGFPTECIKHKEKMKSDFSEYEEFDKFTLFKILEECDKNGRIMSCGSPSDNDDDDDDDDNDNDKKTGIISDHAYSIIEAKRLEKDKIYLIKIRNPWGFKEWKGDWSDSSNCWTPEYKEYFGLKKEDDGIFWMDIEDYFNNFKFTDICHIFYGALVRNFYFEYEDYFKKPIIFNFFIKEKSKVSVRVIFKNWRFNRDIRNETHPCVLLIGNYDKERKIKSLYSKYSIYNDVNFVKTLESGYYIAWLYCYNDGKNNFKNFKYTVQISSVNSIGVEFLGPDKEFKLLQFLLLENYIVENEDNYNLSNDYFFGSYQQFSKSGLINRLIYNKSEKIMEVTINTEFKGCFALPPYKDEKTIKITLLPFERDAIVYIPIESSFKVKFDQKIELKDCDIIDKNNFDNEISKYFRFMKIDISNISSPDVKGYRFGEYKYVELLNAKEIPVFDKDKLKDGNSIRKSSIFDEVITPEILREEYPKEINLLLSTFPNEQESKIIKLWDKLENDDGIYLGEVNSITNELEGRGAFIWKNETKYIGLWKNNEMCGKGMLFNKNNELIFEGEFKFSKKNGRGKIHIKKNEYIESVFCNDKMGNFGVYHFENGNKWGGNFINFKKNGVGIMINAENDDIFLMEYKNDNFIGLVSLSNEEKKLLMKKREELIKERGGFINKKEKRRKEEEQKLLEEEQKGKEIIEKSEDEKEKEIKINDVVQNLYIKKSCIISKVIVEKTNDNIKESPEDKKHNIFLERMEKFKHLEPFMAEKFLVLLQNEYYEEIEYIKNNNKIYLGQGIIKENENKNEIIKQGKGVFFKGSSYYAGNWNNDQPYGFFYKYNSKKQLTFKGFLLPGYKINPQLPSYAFFQNGDKYHGFFSNNQLSGFGIYYHLTGESWTGQFSKGKFNGKGKLFYSNGFLSGERIVNNSSITTGKISRDDFNDPNAINFFEMIIKKYPGVIEKILLLPPYKRTQNILLWSSFINEDGSIYIGQVDKNKTKCGRCCFIYENQPITYRLGYVENQNFFGNGFYYDHNWNLIFEGRLENSKKNGFGIYNYPNCLKYAGFFSNDKPNGNGVQYFKNGSRFEGNFLNSQKNGKGYIISSDLKTKQELTFKNDNIINLGEIFYLKELQYQNQLSKDFQEFEQKCISLGYEKYLSLLRNLKPTYDSCALTLGIKEEDTKIYIGEMNSIRFKHGRGILLDQYTEIFFVGYFENDLKNGYGTIYKKYGEPKYIGEFVNNNPIGHGEYRHSNGDYLKGEFNQAGEGNGIYTFANGDYWKGGFYSWALNGTGEYYIKDGTFVGERTFEYSNPIYFNLSL